MLSFVVYFFTIATPGAAYVVDTMPVDTAEACMTIVAKVNTQPTDAGRKVKASCFIGPAKT